MGGAIEGEGLMILDLAVGERYSADVEESTKKSKPAYKPHKYKDLGNGWRRVTHLRHVQPRKIVTAE
jgi:hypothetical protein